MTPLVPMALIGFAWLLALGLKGQEQVTASRILRGALVVIGLLVVSSSPVPEWLDWTGGGRLAWAYICLGTAMVAFIATIGALVIGEWSVLLYRWYIGRRSSLGGLCAVALVLAVCLAALPTYAQGLGEIRPARDEHWSLYWEVTSADRGIPRGCAIASVEEAFDIAGWLKANGVTMPVRAWVMGYGETYLLNDPRNMQQRLPLVAKPTAVCNGTK